MSAAAITILWLVAVAILAIWLCHDQEGAQPPA